MAIEFGFRVDAIQLSFQLLEFIVQGISVPYVIFPNEDDVTTERGPALGQRLADTLSRLWRVYAPG